MNTPVHVTLALAALGRKDKPKLNTPIVVGALIPDIAMFLLFFYEVAIGTPQMVIWNQKYYSPLWQNTTDLFNSIPIFIAIYLVALHKKWTAVQVLCLAGLLHLLTDLPLHHDDGHRHFYPFSDWRFESPVSYWDPNHYGHYWSIFEAILLMVTAYLSYKIIQNKWAQIILVTVCLVSLLMPLFFYFTLSW